METTQQKAFALQLLRAQDSNIKSILHSHTYVAVYQFNNNDHEFINPNCSGSLFIVKNKEGQCAVVVVNQKNPKNFQASLIASTKVSTQKNFIYIKNRNDIYAIWIYSKREIEKLFRIIAEIVEKSLSAESDKQSFSKMNIQKLVLNKITHDRALMQTSSASTSSTDSDSSSESEVVPAKPLVAVQDLYRSQKNTNSKKITCEPDSKEKQEFRPTDFDVSGMEHIGDIFLSKMENASEGSYIQEATNSLLDNKCSPEVSDAADDENILYKLLQGSNSNDNLDSTTSKSYYEGFVDVSRGRLKTALSKFFNDDKNVDALYEFLKN